MRTSKLILCGLGLIGVLCSYSCKQDDDDVTSEYTVQESIGELVSIQDTVSITDSIELRVRIRTPTPCYLFDGYYYSAQANKMNVTFYTKYKKDEICIQVTGKIDTLVKLKPFDTGLNIITLNPNTNFEIVDTIFITN